MPVQNARNTRNVRPPVWPATDVPRRPSRWNLARGPVVPAMMPPPAAINKSTGPWWTDWDLSVGGRPVHSAYTMTQLDLELAALRLRRSPGITAWLRGLSFFDRRAIREPGDRDEYWARVQRRLAASDSQSRMWYRATPSGSRPTR